MNDKSITKICFFFPVLGIWTVSSGVAGYLDLEMYTAECYCSPMPMNPIQHFFITFMFGFACPFLVIVTCYLCIFVKLRQKLMLKFKQRKESKRNKIEMVILDTPEQA